MAAKETYPILNERLRQLCIADILELEYGHTVEVKKPKRTVPQNTAIHAVVLEWANACNWHYNGQRLQLVDFKTIAMSAYRRWQNQDNGLVLPGLYNEPVALNLRTSELSKREAGEFIDMFSAIAAQAR